MYVRVLKTKADQMGNTGEERKEKGEGKKNGRRRSHGVAAADAAADEPVCMEELLLQPASSEQRGGKQMPLRGQNVRTTAFACSDTCSSSLILFSLIPLLSLVSHLLLLLLGTGTFVKDDLIGRP